MDNETNQETTSLLPNNYTTTTTKELESPPRSKPAQQPPLGGSGSDRLKRDEWSEGAVSTLLEAYETKWALRNRAKLKGHDWEDVATHVSSRANCTKAPKTQTQCKNKIESMKKRYRSESATADGSSWPLYPRLDLLLRGSGPSPTAAAVAAAAAAATVPPSLQPPLPLHPPLPQNNHPLMLLEPSAPAPLPPPPPLPAPPPLMGTAQNSFGSNGVDHRVAKEDGGGMKLSDHASDKNPLEVDSSTPALYSDKEKLRSRRMKRKIEKKKRRRREEVEVAESIRWLAEVVVRSEQARMDTMREIERMRAEAEAKRGEMDLKRTEIIANTQLEIARLFAAAGVGKGVDSSLRIGRS
ncbi:actin cytoskeleton-regulatory complex protein pan1-like [Pyrus ussuriensis x Pyrus communis]|uniref:Actin cytoskeleton-regulatory complex protein pan1-like n=1 Tax=Pyrus ussuriensis x Pyrus communis TaxID=2448454 RepID=A0A5N5FCV3_9ROSA|nr:actin cytoskeleton-regulatory complex protein pan1-like [Pyrus ussuriensis x Pyrus communis]